MASQQWGDGPRPDQVGWTRMQVGMASPLWLPFMLAASAGAAWWTYANIARVSAGASLTAARSVTKPAAAPPPEAPSAPVATAPEPQPVPAIVSAPTPEPVPFETPAPVETALESIAVVPEAAAHEPLREEPPVRAKRKPKASSGPLFAEPVIEDAADLVDAAYAENLGPVPPPIEKTGKGGGKRKKKG